MVVFKVVGDVGRRSVECGCPEVRGEVGVADKLCFFDNFFHSLDLNRVIGTKLETFSRSLCYYQFPLATLEFPKDSTSVM